MSEGYVRKGTVKAPLPKDPPPKGPILKASPPLPPGDLPKLTQKKPPPLPQVDVVSFVEKPTPVKYHSPSERSHKIERACVCALAVSLLWATSLVVAQSLVASFIPSPTYDDVYASGVALLNVSEVQRTKYGVCAEGNAYSCETKYTQQSNKLWGDVNATQAELDRLLVLFRKEYELSVAAYYESIFVLSYLGNNSVNIDTFGTGAVGCPSVSSIVGKEFKKQFVIQEAGLYNQEGSKAVNGLRDSFEARAIYDANYFSAATGGYLGGLVPPSTDPDAILASVNLTLNQAIACATQGEYGGEVCPESAVLLKYQTMYLEMESSFTELIDKGKAYRDDTYAKLNNYKDLYNRILAIKGKLIDAFPPSANFFSIFDTIFPGLSDDLGALLGLDIYKYLNDPEELKRELEAQAAATTTALQAEANRIASANINVATDMDGVKGAILSDYNPPPRQDNATYDETTDEFINQLSGDLNGVDADKASNTLSDAKQFDAKDSATNLLSTLTPRPWGFFTDNETYKAFFEDITSISNWAKWIDIAFRIVKSFMIIRKYWNSSALNLPPADVRSQAGLKAGLYTAKKNIIQKVGMFITHPAFHMITMLIFGILFSLAFYSAYQPLYTEYTENCVERCYTDVVNTLDNSLIEGRGNGTMMYRNFYTIASQYVYADGDYVTTTRIEDLNHRIKLACKERVITSLNVQLDQDNEFSFYNTSFEGIRSKIVELRRCANMANVNATVNGNPTFSNELAAENKTIVEPVFGATASMGVNAFVFPGQYTERLYDCDKISSCQMTCPGPSEPIIRGSAFASSCTTEWYFHASSLGWLMVAVIYVVVNISRIYFLRGVVQVYWRHLAPDRFHYLASCSQEGIIMYPEAVPEKSFKHEIIHQLRITIKRYEREAWLILLFGVLINIPWIVFLDTLKRNLAFNKDKICD